VTGVLDQSIAKKPGTASQKQYRYCHQLQLKMAVAGLVQKRVIYRTEPTTKKRKNRKKLKVENRYAKK